MEKDEQQFDALREEGATEQNGSEKPGVEKPGEGNPGSEKPGNPGSGKPNGSGNPGTRNGKSNRNTKNLKVTTKSKTASMSSDQASSLVGVSDTELRGKAKGAQNESIGRQLITGVEGLSIGDKVFIDSDKNILTLLNRTNLPNTIESTAGAINTIDKFEEVVGLPTVPVCEGYKPKYPKNNKMSATDSMLIVEDTAKTAPTSGVYIGSSMSVKKGIVESVSLIDATPFDPTTADFNFDSDSTRLIGSDAKLQINEAKVLYDLFKKHEDTKVKGLSKNPLYLTANSKEWLKLLIDINRDTTATIERAFVCAGQFLSSINEDRYFYGHDQNNRFSYLMAKVAPVIDLTNDVRKYNTTSDLLSLPYLTQYFKNAIALWSKHEKKFYCYPRTTLMVKKHLRQHLTWHKYVDDYRAPVKRNVLAYTTMFQYGTSSVDGVTVTSDVGIGGKSIREYMSWYDGNIMPKAIKHPIFDGITAALQRYSGKSVLLNFADGVNVPLTFDPEFPVFSFLILLSIGEIIKIMDVMFADLYDYVNDGGVLPKTVMSYPTSKIATMLAEMNIGESDWRNELSGPKYTTDKVNLRMEFPETAVLSVESADDDKSLYSYHPGILSGLMIRSNGGVNEFTAKFKQPVGPANYSTLALLDDVNPVILVNNKELYSNALYPAAAEYNQGTYKTIERISDIPLKGVTVKQWLTSCRFNSCGFIAIPSGLIFLDVVDLTSRSIMTTTIKEKVKKDGKMVEVEKEVNLYKQSNADLKDFLSKNLNATAFKGIGRESQNGIALCSYRMHFGVTVDDYSKAHVVIANIAGDGSYSMDAVTLAYQLGGYEPSSGNAGRVIVAVGDSVGTHYKVSDLIKFPIGNAGIIAKLGRFEKAEQWAYYANLLGFWSNPMSRVRETNEAGVDDAIIHITPHQIINGNIWFVAEVDGSVAFRKYVAYIEEHINDICERPF